MSIKNFEYGTDGSGSDYLIVKNSGIKKNNEISVDVYDENGSYVSNDDYLYMNGKEIFVIMLCSPPASFIRVDAVWNLTGSP